MITRITSTVILIFCFFSKNFIFRIKMAEETPQGPFTMEEIHDQLQDMNRYNPENQVS